MSARSLSSSTYDELLRRLLGGQLRPGQVFNRRQLAADLGVSVAPLLEALVLLECEGLIVTTPRKGTRVRAITDRDVQGLQVVREALECQAARLACGQPVEKQATKLRRLAEELDTAGSPPHDAKALVRFHHSIVALAAVPSLTDAYERIMKLHLLHAVHAAPAPRSPGKSFVALVEALHTHDPDKAEAAMRKHLQSELGPASIKADKGEKRTPNQGPHPSWLGEG